LRASLCNWLPFARALAGAGYRVLAFDSRNAGESAVAPYPKSVQLEKDVLAAEKELLRRGAKRIVLGGASAGGTAAMTAAASVGPALAGVIVLSSPAQYIQMDAEAAAKRVTAPSFFAVGRGDVDFVAEMQKLYDASAAKRKQLEILETGAHGTDMLRGSTAGVLRPKLLAFLVAAFAQ
jgi:pimeloyl-ACP methyl ester carboxylesterase